MSPQGPVNEHGGLPRAVDASAAAFGLLLLSPLLLLVALAVRLGSPGPVLFRQQRVGRHGVLFELKKFRSMTVAEGGPEITAGDDQRVTAVGRVLRRTKLDELPELWNILVGDMAFVGPRPEVPRYYDAEDPLWQEVVTARPGLTDPVTLRLRNEEDLLASVGGDRDRFYRRELLPWKLAGYSRYLRRRHAGSDILVLLRTVGAILWPSTEPPPTLDEIRSTLPT